MRRLPDVSTAQVPQKSPFTYTSAFNDTVLWFEHSLNLPFPTLLTALALGSEIIGGVLLLLGLGVSLIALPLMLVMLVAAFLVHFENGWLAISDSSSWLANQQVLDAAEKKTTDYHNFARAW